MKKLLMMAVVAMLPFAVTYAGCGKDHSAKKKCCGTDGKCCKSGEKHAHEGHKHLDAPEGFSRVKYDVSGMTCGGCSGKLTKMLTAIEGVKVNKVCHKSGSADVTIKDGTASEKDVQKAIAAAGFKTK